jgi:alkanesulfonate monooxygenase SsuD/methylene tetrahydromethanopterin reductase-like flavin-dependent oxidoreductase (luciferase family)
MKFSISLPTGFEGVMYPIPFVDPADFVRLAKLCERLGYHSVWGNDHITTQDYVRELFPGQPPNFYELLTVLSFCAAATTTLKVGMAVAVLSMRDPFWLAKQAATIDQMSGGRFILGVGIGAYREEFAAWAPRLKKEARRGDMLDEGLALMQPCSRKRASRMTANTTPAATSRCFQSRSRTRSRSGSAGTTWRTSSVLRASAPAGCPAGVPGRSSPSASRF